MFAIVRSVGIDLAALRAGSQPATWTPREVLAADEGLGGLLDGPGLRRGWTVLLEDHEGAGGTSLLLRLLSAPSTAGIWCALVNFPAVGFAAAEELGVALDRLVAVADPGARFPSVVAALLEGCDLVIARPPRRLSRSDVARLVARTRERRAVLVVAGCGIGALPGIGALRGSHLRGAPLGNGHLGLGAEQVWPGEVDVRLEVTGSSWFGIGPGHGRLMAHRIEVVARLRRASPAERRHLLWLHEPPVEVVAPLGRAVVRVSKEAGPDRATG